MGVPGCDGPAGGQERLQGSRPVSSRSGIGDPEAGLGRQLVGVVMPVGVVSGSGDFSMVVVAIVVVDWDELVVGSPEGSSGIGTVASSEPASFPVAVVVVVVDVSRTAA